MPNIYSINARLATLQSIDLQGKQRQFIATIIDGKPGENGWKNLKSLMISPDYTHMTHLIKTIQEEIEKKSDEYLNGRTYIRVLKNVVSTLENVMKHHLEIENLNKKTPKGFVKRANKLNTLFEKTSTTYNGTIMLPVSQGYDVRLGDSKGECFGYTAVWAKSLLKTKAAFGVKANQSPPFKPIKLTAKRGGKHFELNHLALLTEEISSHQSSQKLFPRIKQGLQTFIGNFTGKSNSNSVVLQDLKSTTFYQSIESIASELVSYADKNSDKIYTLDIFSYRSGHTLGFCKIDNQYHFFDSNRGWMRFENANDFKQWLPFYFKLIGYDKMFAEYAITTYFVGNPQKVFNEWLLKKSFFTAVWAIISVVISSILLPILAPVVSPIVFAILSFVLPSLRVIAELGNYFIIRGLRYKIKSFMDKKDALPDEQILESTSTTPQYDLPKSRQFEALDLAIHNQFIASKPRRFFDNPSINETQARQLDALDLEVIHSNSYAASKS